MWKISKFSFSGQNQECQNQQDLEACISVTWSVWLFLVIWSNNVAHYWKMLNDANHVWQPLPQYECEIFHLSLNFRRRVALKFETLAIKEWRKTYYRVRKEYSHVRANIIIKYHAEYIEQLKFTNFIQMRNNESANKVRGALWIQ